MVKLLNVCQRKKKVTYKKLDDDAEEMQTRGEGPHQSRHQAITRQHNHWTRSFYGSVPTIEDRTRLPRTASNRDKSSQMRF